VELLLEKGADAAARNRDASRPVDCVGCDLKEDAAVMDLLNDAAD
jgi:hypothetical protein